MLKRATNTEDRPGEGHCVVLAAHLGTTGSNCFQAVQHALMCIICQKKWACKFIKLHFESLACKVTYILVVRVHKSLLEGSKEGRAKSFL